jgi:hypothetical protein
MRVETLSAPGGTPRIPQSARMPADMWPCELCPHPPFPALFSLVEHLRIAHNNRGGLSR